MTIRKEDMEQDFDKALRIWARADLADDAAVERLVASASALASAPVRPGKPTARSSGRPAWWPWALAGSVAASLAAAALLLPSSPVVPPAPGPVSTHEVQLASFEDDEDAIDSFALLFTPTYEEEEFI